MIIRCDNTTLLQGTAVVFTRVTKQRPRMLGMKARFGHGRKRDACVEALQEDHREETDRPRKFGEKFDLTTIRLLAFDLLQKTSNDSHSFNMIIPRVQQLLNAKVNLVRIQA